MAKYVNIYSQEIESYKLQLQSSVNKMMTKGFILLLLSFYGNYGVINSWSVLVTCNRKVGWKQKTLFAPDWEISPSFFSLSNA